VRKHDTVVIKGNKFQTEQVLQRNYKGYGQITTSQNLKILYEHLDTSGFTERPTSLYRARLALCSPPNYTLRHLLASSSHASKLWEEPLQGLACRVSAADAAAVVTQSLQHGNLSSYNEKRVEVAWNNAFRKIFNAYWHERIKALQYYCSCLPVSILLPMKKLLFWKKMLCSGNLILCR